MSDPLLNPSPAPELLADGRQSVRALEVQRGVCRLFAALGHMPLTELSLKTGRRVDVATLSAKGDITVVEIKTSTADYRADGKWPDYLDYCDRLYFAVPRDFPLEILPEETGLILADRFGAEIVRDAPEDRLVAARRKAVTLLFARAAARRLHRAIDPDLESF